MQILTMKTKITKVEMSKELYICHQSCQIWKTLHSLSIWSDIYETKYIHIIRFESYLFKKQNFFGEKRWQFKKGFWRFYRSHWQAWLRFLSFSNKYKQVSLYVLNFLMCMKNVMNCLQSKGDVHFLYTSAFDCDIDTLL